MANITKEHLYYMARRHYMTMPKLDGSHERFAVMSREEADQAVRCAKEMIRKRFLDLSELQKKPTQPPLFDLQHVALRSRGRLMRIFQRIALFFQNGHKVSIPRAQLLAPGRH